MNVLIIDDDAGIRQLIALYLGHKGVASISAANGQEALEQLQAVAVPPDFILLDLMMPVMDGASFRHAQRADPQLASIPVVVMSAAENIDIQAPALTADAYLPKPIDFDSLAALIERYSSHSRAHGV
jgi:CheY-like chemotaxis protein